ncbi:hypothetical protein BH09BAC2_BH09BAC2_22010 [soil metagenome]
MKKYLIIFIVSFFSITSASAQIDLNNIDLSKIDINTILNKIMKVDKGFAPKFFLGNTPLQKISKVAEILGLKKNADINKLFSTFKTGRLIYKIAAYTGGALAVYAIAKKIDKAAQTTDYKGALITGVTTITSGLAVKFLTKGASYKAVDLFNGMVRKKIQDIFSVAPASQTLGVGLYVKL